MSTKLSLRDALERRARPDERQSHFVLPFTSFIVQAEVIPQPVEVARFLMQCGLSLRKAHEILDRISAGERVPVQLRADNAEAIASELKQLGVSALALKNPEQ